MFSKVTLIFAFLFVSCRTEKKIVACKDTVVVYFKITTIDGSRVDASGRFHSFIEQDRPFSFVTCNSEVIKGWDRQIIGNKLGSKYKIEVNSEDAYGNSPIDRDINANSDLIIEYEIIDIK